MDYKRYIWETCWCQLPLTKFLSVNGPCGTPFRLRRALYLRSRRTFYRKISWNVEFLYDRYRLGLWQATRHSSVSWRLSIFRTVVKAEKRCLVTSRYSEIWPCEWIEALGSRDTGIILGMGSANERRRHIVTSSLIGWVHTQNDPCDK